ncbi:MFS transporter [Rhodobacteraceae bacterium IMCC15231]|nr:MFS transporter [Rhodobacteraceae bacterium IMCC15231]
MQSLIKMNLSAFNFRGFRLYLLGNLFAINALWMQRVTIGWIAWDLTKSATFVGFIAFINFAPAIITGPLFGVLIDRVNVKKAAQVTQFSLFTISVGFYLFFIWGGLNELFLSMLSLLSGIATSAHNPVRLSLAPRLVNHRSVSSVVSIVAINFNLARLTGPAIAGWLIAVWGLQITLLIQSLLYLPFILMLNLLRPRDQVPLKAGQEPFLAALRSGVKHTLSNSLMRQALLITSLYAFLIRGTLEILPVIADGIFAKGAAGLGILTSISGFGAVVAGITKVFTQSQKAGEIPKFVIASALLGVALIPLVGLSNSWELTVGYICYLGFAGTLSGISIQTALQMDLPDHFRGRVMSLWTVVNVGATATGAMMLGGLADYIGIPTAFCFAGGLGTVLLLTAVLKNR